MENDSHADRAHSELGGSSASRWINCPGSVSLLRTLPPEEASSQAKQGTLEHEIGEIVVTDFLNHKIDGSNPDIRACLYADDEEALINAYAYRDIIWKEVLQESLTGKAWGVEDRFILDFQLKMFGFVDFWAVYLDDHGKRVGVIVDYKTGFYPVEAKNNSQLAFYAVAMRQEMIEGGKDLDYVRAVIFQPKAPVAYQEIKFTQKQLETWKKKFLKAAHTIYVAKKVTLKAGNWCQFCRAKAVCKAYQSNLSSKNGLKLIDPDKIELPPIEKVPDAMISELLLKADIIEDYIKAARSYAITRHRESRPLPGLKVIAGTSRRTWQDNEQEIVNTLIEEGIENPLQSKLKGITVIEKELSKLMAKDKAKAIVDSLCEPTLATPKIVPSSDPRPALPGNLEKLGSNKTEGK